MAVEFKIPANFLDHNGLYMASFSPGTNVTFSVVVDHDTETATVSINASGGTGTVTSVGLSFSGASFITVSGSPVTTSGTLTGTWTGTVGDTLYASATNTWLVLAGNTTTTKKFLRETGNGVNAAAPAWDTVLKADVGLGSVENTALSTWAGTTNITTLGTISSGTWHGSVVAMQYGGTGANLSDPGANIVWGWDDTDNAWTAITLGTGLTYTHSSHTLSSSGSGGTVTSVTAGIGLNGGTITTSGTIDLAGTIPQSEIIKVTDTATTTQTINLSLEHATSSTPAAGFGVGLRFSLQDSTTAAIDAGDIVCSWINATHGSTASRLEFQVAGTGTSHIMRLQGNGSAPLIGFMGNNAVAVQTGDVGTGLVNFGLFSGTPTFAAANLTGQTALSKGGTAANLSAPGADSLWGYDNTDGAIGFWTIGTGLSYSHASHTLSCSVTGTVTSVDIAGLTSILGWSGNPITTSGTLTGTLIKQTANTVWAGPTSGATATPTFRALVTADMPSGTGTVTSVAITGPSILSWAGSPITTSGTLTGTLANQSANLFLSGPISGGATTPTFRAIDSTDLPSISRPILRGMFNVKMNDASASTFSLLGGLLGTTYQILLQDTSSPPITYKWISTSTLTGDITASGANGLDTGTEANSTWYFVYAIAKADGTQAVLLSVSSSSPTMPTGYIYKALIGAIYNNSGGNFVAFTQYDNEVFIAAQNVLAATAVTTGGTFQSLSISVVVPTIAKTISGFFGGDSTTIATNIRIAGNTAGHGEQRHCGPTIGVTLNNYDNSAPYTNVPLITAQTLYWTSDSNLRSNRIDISKWTF